jgi:hypothetical protein
LLAEVLVVDGMAVAVVQEDIVHQVMAQVHYKEQL